MGSKLNECLIVNALNLIGIGHPARLLRIIRLVLVTIPELIGNLQPRRRIRIWTSGLLDVTRHPVYENNLTSWKVGILGSLDIGSQ